MKVFKPVKLALPVCAAIVLIAAKFGLPNAAIAADPCAAVTVAKMRGVPPGKYPQQYDLGEYQSLAACTVQFKANPDIEKMNKRIRGNPPLPPLAERIPEDALVVVPYHSIGKYGGVFDVMSNATEAGTSDFLAIRHVNLVRYSDDLQTIVPNVAKGWEWNDDFTQLTFFLRKGHKWSDGAPFTAEDVEYWYERLALNPKVREKPANYVLVADKPMT